MTRPTLALVVRTPTGLVIDQRVESVVAEDRDGWFGLLPARAELVAILPAGFLLFTEPEGSEGFVAHAPAVLHHHAGRCRVLTSEASVARRIEDVPEVARAGTTRRAEQAARREDAVGRLVRELQRRLLEVPP